MEGKNRADEKETNKQIMQGRKEGEELKKSYLAHKESKRGRGGRHGEQCTRRVEYGLLS